MTANARWPDFRLASTLWSLVGSQPDQPDKLQDASPPSPAIQQHPTLNEPPVVGPAEDEAHRENQVAGQPATMEADLPNQSIDGLEAFDDDGGMGTDFGAQNFGALELFDSNAVAAPFSTQPQLYGESSSQAPAAVMSADPPSSPPKRKLKRDKKSKKKDALDDAPREEGRHKRAKHASALETSEAADALTTLASAAEPYAQRSDQVEEPASSPIHQKRKRKPSDAASAKKRSKKRRGGDSVDLGTGEASVVGGFLHKNEDADVTAIADEDAEADASDPQGSPIVGHLRRQSHGEEHFSTPDGLMHDGSIPGVSTEAPVSGDTMGDIAREAWHEHIQSQGNANGGDVDMADADVTAEHTYATPPEHEIQPELEAEAEAPGSRPKRSKAKKAKPTFYENPPEEAEYGEEVADDDLPSPSAMTPKRRRNKPATKKRGARRAKDEDEDGENKAPRRSKTEGYTQGRFTDAELQRITKAVESFRDENNLSQRDVNEMVHAAGGTSAGDGHAQLWTRLFAECPDRHRQKVINITRKKFHNFVARGTWTPEQEAELRYLINEHGQKWSKIASMINRHPEDIRDRFRNYIVCGDAQKKDAWTQDEESRLARFVIEAMQAIDELRSHQPNRDVLQKTYEELIDWQNISERMERTRSRLQCITKWKSMHLKIHGNDQLASLQPDSQISFNLERARRQIAAMPEEERYRLVLAIRDTAVGTDAKIPWQKLVDKPFRNEYHRSTQVLLWHRYSKQVPQYDSKTVRDRAQYLLDQYNQIRELPDIDGGDWDDAEEMQCVAAAFSSSQRTPRKKKTKGQSQSNENVPVDAEPEGSDDGEEEGLDDNGEGPSVEHQVEAFVGDAEGIPADPIPDDDGLQIDPALTAEPSVAILETESAPKAAMTPSKPPRVTYGKNRGSARKELSQDPIEDVDETQGPAQGATPAKQRGKGKSKTPGGKGKKTELAPVEASPTGPSGMEGIEDMSAQIPA